MRPSDPTSLNLFSSLITVLFLSSYSSLIAPAHAQDRWTGDWQEAAARNPPGVTSTLRLATGRKSFQQGELIQVVVGFSSTRPDVYKLIRYFQPRPSQLTFGTFHASPQEEVHDPLGDLPPPQGFGINGYVPEPTPLGEQPVEFTLDLNEWLRFDKPGKYRVYCTSNRILQENKPKKDMLASFSGAPVTSNLIEFDILPADPAWAHQEVQDAMAQLSHPGDEGPEPWSRPARVLRYLNTREAAGAMLERMGKDEQPRSAPVESSQYHLGLVGFPDRGWLVHEMEQSLAAPGYPVTQPFLQTLTLMAALRAPAAGNTHEVGRSRIAGEGPNHDSVPTAHAQQLYQSETSLLPGYWRRLAAVVNQKEGRAKAMSLHTLLELAWLDSSLGRLPDVQARLPQLTRNLAVVFDDLPPLPQEYMLGDFWEHVRGPAILPALRRLWASQKPPTAGRDPELANLVLRRIEELDPAGGRLLILKEIASPQPRVSIAALGTLPDVTLPALDNLLAAKLEKSSNDLACLLVARYGSKAILNRVKAVYSRDQGNWACQPQAALLAYFLRVNPAYGASLVKQALSFRKETGCYRTLLADAAALYNSPELEPIAIALLNDPDVETAAGAARMLGKYGSRAARTALLDRLRRSSADGGGRETMEMALVDALATANHWLADHPFLDEVRRLCGTPSARRAVDEYESRLGAGKIPINYQVGDPGYWAVAQYSGVSAPALLAKLSQFPRGATFSWQDITYGAPEEKLFAMIRTFAQVHGMKIERGHPNLPPP